VRVTLPWGHGPSPRLVRAFWLGVCVAFTLCVLPGVVAQAKTIYVDASATPPGNGTLWATAYTDLPFAVQTASSGDQIWVAEGTYRPTSGTDRTATFQLKSGVGLYGGYPSGGGQRDWENNETILSGDIGTEGVNTDNSYHVVTGSGTYATAVLDGFTVRGGNIDNIDGSGVDFCGGGMRNDGGSPTVANCTFSDNRTIYYGGGMCNVSNSNPMVTNCTFSANSADYGGGMYNSDSSPTVANCTFSANEATTKDGGGMLNVSNSSPKVSNCTFSGNVAASGGGMRNFSNSSPKVENCTFSANEGNFYGGGMHNEASNPTLTNCTFSGNTVDFCGGGMCNHASDPRVKNTILAGNTPDDCDGAVTSLGYNLDCDGSCQLTHPTDLPNTDPLLGPLQDNGGPTHTRALEPGSPAIDAGSCDVATDQRGVGRPQGCRCDIGAYESTPVFNLIVTKQGTGSGTVIGDRGCIDCGATCIASYGSGGLVSLTATPGANSLFTGWGGDASGANSTVTITMDGDKGVTACFSLQPYTTGDVNGDSAIDLLDVRLCTQIAQGIITGTPQQRGAADVDSDGDVDMDDVTILSEYVLGARTTLP